jgi:hypothetical protein
MASSYMLGNRVATYVVKVSSTERGRKTLIKKEFTDYDEAQIFLDRMEELYRDTHIVEFDTKFR